MQTGNFHMRYSPHRGFTLIELVVFIFIVGTVLALLAGGLIVDRPSQTQARANDNLKIWLNENSISNTKRASCAHDSDGDGWASCLVVVDDGEERIPLQCIGGFWQGVLGASGCKEVDGNFKVNSRPIVRQ